MGQRLGLLVAFLVHSKRLDSGLVIRLNLRKFQDPDFPETTCQDLINPVLGFDHLVNITEYTHGIKIGRIQGLF